MFNPDVLIDRPLVDAEEHLFFVKSVLQAVKPPHFLSAALQPPGGALHRSLHISPVCLTGGTLIKCHGYGGGQVGLDPHTLLRPHKNPAPVYMRAEMHPFFLNLTQPCQREHLKTARVRKNGLVPGHEAMQPPQLSHHFVPWTHMQVIGVGQLHLGTDVLQVLRGHRALNGRHGTHIHKYRCLHHPVYGGQTAPLGPALPL